MNFEQYKIADIKKAMTALIKRHKTIASATQEMLMGIAYEIEANQSADELTRFIVELSEKDKEGKLWVSSTARQVGLYMRDHMPVVWDNDALVFEMIDNIEDFDFAEAKTAMEATRWDNYKRMKADEAFDADKQLGKAIGMLKGIVAHHDKGELADDDPAYVKARLVLKAVA